MNQTTQGWPAAGIDSAEAARAFKRATAPLRLCESTPSLIETEAGDIVAQTFERHDVDVTDKGRTAEMWARAQLLAAAPELLEALDILREGLEDRITQLGHDPADDARVKLARAAIAKALRRAPITQARAPDYPGEVIDETDARCLGGMFAGKTVAGVLQDIGHVNEPCSINGPGYVEPTA